MAAAPHPLVLRGREALQRGDMRAVEAAAEERLKTAGRDVNALELRFIVQQKRGQYGQAARTLDTVIGIDPRADWAYNELVQLFMVHGKPEDAEKVARAALRANPRNAHAHNLFGTILSEMNNLPAGEWHFRWKLQRRGPWTRGLEPTVEMWEHVLDSLKRRYRRREGVDDRDINQVEKILSAQKK